MTTIRITDRATNPEEVVKYLRKTADLVEALADGATVVVGGDLNIEVRYAPDPDPAIIAMAANPAGTVPTS